MNETTNSKTAFIKALAIIGFFATVALVVWLVVQGLRIAPGSFASLASIAESVQNYGRVDELSIATEKSIVVSGESFKVTWTDLKQKGTYEFTHVCTEGVRIQVRAADGNLVTVPCTEVLSLPHDAHGLFMSVTSERQRFSDVPFTVAFKKTDGTVTVLSEAKVTVVNATIPLVATETIATSTPTVATTTVATVKPEPVKPATQVAAPIAAVKPTVTPTVVTSVPQSNPAGYTDLKVTYVGIGSMDGNSFSPESKFDRSERNGLKFEVMNIGTKTSGSWTFKTTLPGDVVYESPVQIPLKPSERVVFTLGFDIDDEDDDKVTVKSTVYTTGDTNSKNDSFSWVVGVKN